MSVTLKPNNMKYRDPDTGNYKGVDVIAERTTTEQIAEIRSAGTAQKNQIQQKGEQTLATIPSEYTQMYDDLNVVRDDLAPVYDATSTYAVGDLVTHDYQLYKCKTAIETAEAWTAAHWQIIDVDNLNKGIISEIDNVKSAVNTSGIAYMPSISESGFVILANGSKEQSASWSLIQLSLKKGQSVFVKNATAYNSTIAVFSKYGDGTYTSLNTGSGTINDYEYHAIEDIEVVVSKSIKDNSYCYVGESLDPKFESIYNLISYFDKASMLTPHWHNGYINNAGNMTSSNTWVYSDEITLPKGYTLLLKAGRYSGNTISAISEVNSNGTTYRALVIGNGILSVYQYTAVYNTKVIISKHKNEEAFIYVGIINDSLNRVKSTIDNGYLNTGIAGAFIANNGPNPNAEVCGFDNGEKAATYSTRDSVTLFVKNTSPHRGIAYEGCTFTEDSVTFPSTYNISSICEGNYIDCYDNNGNRFTSVVDSVSGQTVHVKYNGFWKKDDPDAGVVTPTEGSIVYINDIDAIWALNTVTQVRSEDKALAAYGYELDIKKDKDNMQTIGMLVASLGRYENNIAYDVTGKNAVAYMSRRDTLSAFESRLNTESENFSNKRVLTRKLTNNGVETVAKIDPLFNYHSDQNELIIDCNTASMKLKDGALEVPALKIGNHILTIDENGEIVIT